MFVVSTNQKSRSLLVCLFRSSKQKDIQSEMDAILRHSYFLGNTSISGTRRRIFLEILVVTIFFFFTVKAETLLSEHIFNPVLKWLFGDNDSLRQELERREADLHRMLNEQRKDQVTPPSLKN